MSVLDVRERLADTTKDEREHMAEAESSVD